MTRRPRIPSTTDTTAADVFRTDDLALATVLCMQGYDTSGLERVGDKRQAEWKFERDDKLDKIVSDYHFGAHMVEPRQFVNAFRRVRKQLYNFLDGRS